METRKVLIVGDSLFAETLVQVLMHTATVCVIGAVPTPADALCVVATEQPDALIVAGTKMPARVLAHLLAAHPDLPIIRADLSANTIQIISSQRVDACPSELLAAIAELPKRRHA